MENLDTGQVNRSAADVYEEFFLPALFAQWAGPVADAAGVQTGQRVLDVACGTGVLARAMVERVSPTGSVVGLDVNEGMLDVARRTAPQIEWRQGVAEELPFADNSFDAVGSQFALMFFNDRRAALREMMRVLKPGGRMAIAVWAALEDTPGYAAMVDLLRRLFGETHASRLYAPYILGNVDELRTLFHQAGLSNAAIATEPGVARFPSIESWVFTDVKGWTLAELIDDAQYARLLAEAEQAMTAFVDGDGRVAFSAPAHIVTAVKN